MEIRVEPYNLQIKDKNISNCQYCNFLLKKEIKIGSYLVEECAFCKYSDRAFATYSSSWQQHFPNGCTCEYKEKEYLYIICTNCKLNNSNICNPVSIISKKSNTCFRCGRSGHHASSCYAFKHMNGCYLKK